MKKLLFIIGFFSEAGIFLTLFIGLWIFTEMNIFEILAIDGIITFISCSMVGSKINELWEESEK